MMLTVKKASGSCRLSLSSLLKRCFRSDVVDNSNYVKNSLAKEFSTSNRRNLSVQINRAPLLQCSLRRSTLASSSPLSSVRLFMSESDYHPIADESLETIQDTIDDVFDSKTEIDYEVSLASGVLNMSFPPHGTWVLNKQTPNRQIWWSSPISGPKRFEYDEADGLWHCTKDGSILGKSLAEEIKQIYPDLKLELEV